MTDEEMRRRILSCLDSLESEEGIRIVYACESGSRAWGFESGDSDYDVRFLYVRPREWYLSIDFEKKPDVVERPVADALDVSGWDLRKALNLLRKSNPPLLEWLGSPIVYRDRLSVAAKLRELRPVYYSPRTCTYHYLRMARNNYRDFLRGPEVQRKKYLYVLRPVLAVLWIEQGLGVVPTEFQLVVERLVEPGRLKDAVDELLRAKKAGAELGLGPPLAPINDFLDRELDRLDPKAFPRPERHEPVEELNRLFADALDEAWGN
jgi:predicted nucleotidyltransferase